MVGARRSCRDSILLLVIVLIGLGLRVWYAAEALRIDRFEDEKYSLLNIRSIVTDGTLAPAGSFYPYPLFNLPPALLVAGSEILHERTEDPIFEAVTDEGFGAATFLLTRLVQVLYGTLCLLLTFLIGREIFSSGVGLIGALILAFMPWHIHASGYFKPDVQLVAMVLLAFYWSLAAVRDPSMKNYLFAGVGVSLAMSSKLTGGVAAVPLVVGTLALGWRDKSRLALLVLSGLVSAGTFALLNPYWRHYPAWLGGVERDYAMRAAARGLTREQIPERVAALIAEPYMLGLWLGALSLGGFVVLACHSILAWTGSSWKRAQVWMLLSFPVAFTSAYAWRTANFKDNNFLALMPFFSLVTGWALVQLWLRTERLWPRRARAPARILGIGLICLMVMPKGWIYTYRATTPTTLDRAYVFLGRKLRPATGRLVLVGEMPDRRPVWEGRNRSKLRGARFESVDGWQEISDERRDVADGWIFQSGSQRPIQVEQLSRKRYRRFEPRPFILRGPALTAVVSDWTLASEPATLPVRGCGRNRDCLAADLPLGAVDSARVSLVVTLGFNRGESVEDVKRLRIGTREVPLLLASKTDRRAIFMTEKLVLPEAARSLVLQARRQILRRRHLKIELYRWTNRGSPG